MIGKPGGYIREARPQGLKIGATASPDHGEGIRRAAVRTRKKPHAGIVEAACACRTSGTTEARTLIELRLDGHIVGEVAEKDGVPAQSRRKYGGGRRSNRLRCAGTAGSPTRPGPIHPSAQSRMWTGRRRAHPPICYRPAIHADGSTA